MTDPAGYELGHREAYRSEEDKNGEAPQFDDITMMAFRYNGGSK